MTRNVARAMPFLFLLFLVGCQGPEDLLLKKYFSAVQFNDRATMSSIAVEPLAPNLVKWEKVSAGAETTDVAQLKTLSDAEAQAKKNLDDLKAKAREAKEAMGSAEDTMKIAKKKEKGTAQSALDTKKADYDKIIETVKEAQKNYNDAKNATAFERKTIVLSVGDIPDLEKMDGEFRAKDVVVKLTEREDGNEVAKDYVVTLRQYKMVNPATNRQMRGKWIILRLKPQA